MGQKLAHMGSYHPSDVIFLLKDLSHINIEKDTNAREKAIQDGVHYSEMLPVEYKPSQDYMNVFFQSLNESKQKVALAVGIVAERILKEKGQDIVLCSLARAGTPVGILIKRYIDYKYRLSLPHYSISIIRDRGIDRNALQYILNHHPNKDIVFIDGWTGKGAITKELHHSISRFNNEYGMAISSDLAVLADPGDCSSIYGTRDDFLIPSACLNSTVSGLVSRTILNEQWIGPQDFHGAKFYKELLDEDVSNLFIDTISEQFPMVIEEVDDRVIEPTCQPNWEGLASITNIQKSFAIDNTHLIKPGVGETTRVLLRRVPWKVLVNTNSIKSQHLEHILLLAEDRRVPIEEYSQMTYSCCGLIKPLENNS